MPLDNLSQRRHLFQKIGGLGTPQNGLVANTPQPAPQKPQQPSQPQQPAVQPKPGCGGCRRKKR